MATLLLSPSHTAPNKTSLPVPSPRHPPNLTCRHHHDISSANAVRTPQLPARHRYTRTPSQDPGAAPPSICAAGITLSAWSANTRSAVWTLGSADRDVVLCCRATVVVS